MTTGEVLASEGSNALLDARIHSIAHEAQGILLFDIRPTRGQQFPGFEAGAHIDLHLPNGLNRSYSIVNSQDDSDRYLIAVKNEVSGRGGSRFIHAELRVGDTIRIGGPRNNFRLREMASHSVLIAGGIGITPLYGMIQRLEHLNRSWELHYAAADREQAAFVPQLEALQSGTHFYFRSDRPMQPALDLHEVVSSAPDDADFYCCGPNRMLEAFEVATASRKPENVHAEYFTAREAPAVEGGFEVTLQRSGRRVMIQPGETILDALIKLGVDIPFSCMEGVCGSCQVGVVEGIPDHRDLILSKQEREKNDRMLVCCSGSKSARLVLDL